MTITPDIRYVASSDETAIAYWVQQGTTARPLLMMPDLNFSNISFELADPSLNAWYERLSERRTVVRFDRRGAGLSSIPNEGGYGFEPYLTDLEAVPSNFAAPRGRLLRAQGLEVLKLRPVRPSLSVVRTNATAQECTGD